MAEPTTPPALGGAAIAAAAALVIQLTGVAPLTFAAAAVGGFIGAGFSDPASRLRTFFNFILSSWLAATAATYLAHWQDIKNEHALTLVSALLAFGFWPAKDRLATAMPRLWDVVFGRLVGWLERVFGRSP